MPYITDIAKRRLDWDTPLNAGELNYLITRVILDYQQTHGLCYATINDIVGALEGAKLEYYRRIATPYEDEKIKSNGDVYNES